MEKIKGNEAGAYLKERNFQNLAIYGKGTLGTLLYSEIEKYNFNVICFIDKNIGNLQDDANDIPVIRPDDLHKYNDIDAIIVTPVFIYNEIFQEIRKKCPSANIISLEDILYNLG
jgi:FlaA1/EpsC-like NDP-sugar epimerase